MSLEATALRTLGEERYLSGIKAMETPKIYSVSLKGEMLPTEEENLFSEYYTLINNGTFVPNIIDVYF